MNGIGSIGNHMPAQMTTIKSRSHINEGSAIEEMHESQAERMKESQQGGTANTRSGTLSMNGVGNKINLFA